MADITSLQNPLVKRIRFLQKKKKRRVDEGCFWAEGIRPVLEALELGWEIEVLLWCPEMLRSDAAAQAIAAASVRKLTVSEPVFHKLSASELPQGMGALIRIPHRSLADLPAGPETFLAVLEEPQDRGNVGAVVRNIDCAGGSGVVLLGRAVDPYDPQSIRVSMGSLFNIPVVTCPDRDQFLQWARDQGLWLVGTSTRASTCCRDLDYRFPLALVFGNEQQGLSTQMQQAVDTMVRIPIKGRASSLNLGAATAIMAYEAMWHLEQAKSID